MFRNSDTNKISTKCCEWLKFLSVKQTLYFVNVQCLVLRRSYCNPVVFVVLQLSYTVELDKKKADLESESNAFRRMFFMDDLTKERVFVISGVHNLTKQRDSYCSRPRTVYLKVFKSCYRKLRRLLVGRHLLLA